MPFPLRPDEMPFYPQPFVETEVHLMVITNQRIVQFGDEGRQEMEAREVGSVGRISERPLLLVGVLLLLVALPVLIGGVYLVATARGPLSLGAAPTAAAAGAAAGAAAVAAVNDDPASPAGDDPAAPASSSPWLSEANWQRLQGAGLALLGLVLLVSGLVLAARQRHLVLVRGGPKVIKLRAASKIEQTQIVGTLQALQQTARSAPPAAAAKAKPKVDIDDKGDPVKALQDLAAQRAAGKVPEEEFLAKREILLERVKARR